MSFDPRPAAEMLSHAWRSGQLLHELPEAIRPRTLPEGYDVQDALVASMGRAGGWKLGVGSKAAMRGANLQRPLAGRVLADRIHRSGAVVRLPNSAPVTVEFEVAFVIGRDIAPTDVLPDPMAAVERMHVTFELVLSRFVNRRAVGWPSFVGDSVGFEALVVGPEISDIDAVAPSVVIEVDGVELARGLAGDEVTEPRVAWNYLLEHARQRGATLERGQIATLGAIGKPFDVSGPSLVVARCHGAEIAVQL